MLYEAVLQLFISTVLQLSAVLITWVVLQLSAVLITWAVQQLSAVLSRDYAVYVVVSNSSHETEL